MKLKKTSILVIILTSFVFFASVLYYNYFYYGKFIKNQCQSNCLSNGYSASELNQGYVGSKLISKCFCENINNELKEGYFFSDIPIIDWLSLVFLKLFAIAIFLFVFIYFLSRIVRKIEN